MQSQADTPAIAMQVTRGVVMASIQVDLTDEVLFRFRDDLLRLISDTGSHGVIFDLSGLTMLDSHEFAGLRRLMTMSGIMGADPVLVGLRPGVVSALIESGADVDDVRAAASLDAAFALLEKPSELAPAQPEMPGEVQPGSSPPAGDMSDG